jgi:hypothetical protein
MLLLSATEKVDQMNWEAVGAIAEMVGGIAVLITLVYLAVQLRHANRMQRQTLLTNQTAHWVANCQTLGANPELNRAWHKALRGDDMTQDERWQWSIVLYGVILDFEEMYYLHKEGYEYEFRWRSIQRALGIYLSVPAGERWWDTAKHLYFDPELVDYIDTSVKS